MCGKMIVEQQVIRPSHPKYKIIDEYTFSINNLREEQKENN